MDEDEIAESAAHKSYERDPTHSDGKLIPWAKLAEWHKQILIEEMQGSIAAYKAALADAGYVIRPREATDEMLDAGYGASGPIDGSIAYGVVDAIWHAMNEAAPKL